MAPSLSCCNKTSDVTEVRTLDCCEGLVACLSCDCSRLCLGPKCCQSYCNNCCSCGDGFRGGDCLDCWMCTWCMCYCCDVIVFIFDILLLRFF